MVSESPEAEQKPSRAVRTKAVFLNLARIIAATLLLLLSAEIVVRALGNPPSVVPIAKGRFRLSPNLKIGYEPIPNIQYDGKSLEFFQYRGTSNRLGYRGPTYPEVAASGVYRIVALGDSVTEGMRVHHYEDLYTAKVERALREEGMNAQVLNFGVSGYNTQQEVETLKDKALLFHPDLVLLAYTLNDTDGPYYFLLNPLIEKFNNKKNPHVLGGFVARCLVKSALYRLLRFRLLAPNADEEKQLTYKQYATGNTVAEYANALGLLSESHGFQVLVVVFPMFTDPSFTSYAFHDDHSFIREIAMEQDFLFLDLLPAYTACAKETKKPLNQKKDKFHPNIRGHTCAANAITEFILEIKRGR